LDRDTGVVIEARVQSRYVIWMADEQNPAGPLVADIDNKNIVVASQDLRFTMNR
jgi:hypothetical protein